MPPSTEHGQPVILLADDDSFMRSIVANLVRTSLRYEVVIAASGRDAIDRLGAWSPPVSLALLDFVMPDGNGLEVARAIRSGLGRVPRDLPIAMLTGRTDFELVRAAMELDVNAYVVKPVTRETLFQRLERAWTLPFDLKPAEVYRKVEIPSPFGPERVRKPAAPVPLPTPPGPHPCEPAARSARVETRVADLTPGVILAAAVRGNNDGSIILPAHIRLDRALIARLSDLAEIGMIPPAVFVIARQEG
ncbi:CheY-like chemotaxis protein [Azospirillum agricola]|uniref:response regulator n=1 Tax=Azospirillum agricola TaxID=1720247 RepID=UPI001AE8686F|nr:response regulator [Azospirillum agricola]MBP2232398.1 CheY-like chemotaxis protein [Azospirillum agricola]